MTVRIALLLAVALLTGCSHGFEFHLEEMTPQQMLDRADLVFIGTIESQHFDSYPFFQVSAPPGISSDGWHPLRRRVRVETVLRGEYSATKIDVYEVSSWLGASGDWNSTQDGEHALFMVRRESRRWRIVRDWSRSIFEVLSGYHARLPLDESRPFWERYALMNFWIGSDSSGFARMFDRRVDPGAMIGEWRRAKLLRGLLRHPDRRVQIAACIALEETRDPCEAAFSAAEWEEAYSHGRIPYPRVPWNAERLRIERANFARALRAEASSDPRFSTGAMDDLRVMTTVGNPELRREFCGTFTNRFPGDTDNGCYANNLYPATIVTENGDVPLIGDWPAK